MSFRINHLSPVIFGECVSSETGTRLKELGCKKVLCVYDKGVKNAGITDNIIENIQAHGIKPIIFDRVIADPPDYIIEEAAEIGEKVADAIRDLNKQIGLKTLKEHKIDESALTNIAAMVLTEHSANLSPKKANSEDILMMLQGAYSR